MAKRPVETDARGTAIVIPLRSFVHAKARLAGALDDDARAALARAMADQVANACGDHAVVVVTSAAEVVAWAEPRGLAVVADPGSLDGAADAGRAWARAHGFARVAVVHADLPLATSVAALTGDLGPREVVLVPDHRDDGTPALSLPAGAEFTFAYGPGSAARHLAEATARGLSVRIERDPSLAFDVDLEADLARLNELRAATEASR
jgi:2-phospho-L-lactate/phosphoenolpyruvate guanylyltransferase